MADQDTTETELQQIAREVELSAPADVVWAVLTDPDELTDWLGGDADFAIEPGAVGRVTDPDGTVRQVLVTDVEPGERLAWHWWSDDDELSSVELVLEPLDDDRTRIRVTETITADAPAPVVEGFSPLLGGSFGDAGPGLGGAPGPIAPQASVRSLALAGV